MDLVLIGPPGCGKGTQAKRLTGFRHISTGDLFRAALAERSQLGVQIDGLLGTGKLIPDEITLKLVEHVIDGPTVVWDGFPRTVTQAEALDNMLGQRNRSIGAIINLTVPEQTLLDRVMMRFKESKRLDDNPTTFRVRLATYHRETIPVLNYYGDRVITLDGTEPADVIAERIAGIIKVTGILS